MSSNSFSPVSTGSLKINSTLPGKGRRARKKNKRTFTLLTEYIFIVQNQTINITVFSYELVNHCALRSSSDNRSPAS